MKELLRGIVLTIVIAFVAVKSLQALSVSTSSETVAVNVAEYSENR